MTERELIEEIKAEIGDIVQSAASLHESLMDAESCESAEDLIANLEDALKTARGIMTACQGAALPELKQLRKIVARRQTV